MNERPGCFRTRAATYCSCLEFSAGCRGINKDRQRRNASSALPVRYLAVPDGYPGAGVAEELGHGPQIRSGGEGRRGEPVPQPVGGDGWLAGAIEVVAEGLRDLSRCAGDEPSGWQIPDSCPRERMGGDDPDLPTLPDDRD